MIGGMYLSYTIHYGPKKKCVIIPRQKPLGMIIAGLILSAAALFSWARPAQAEALRLRLFPWTSPDVKEAVTRFAADVSQGQPVKEAFGWMLLEIVDDNLE